MDSLGPRPKIFSPTDPTPDPIRSHLLLTTGSSTTIEETNECACDVLRLCPRMQQVELVICQPGSA